MKAAGLRNLRLYIFFDREKSDKKINVLSVESCGRKSFLNELKNEINLVSYLDGLLMMYR